MNNTLGTQHYVHAWWWLLTGFVYFKRDNICTVQSIEPVKLNHSLQYGNHRGSSACLFLTEPVCPSTGLNAPHRQCHDRGRPTLNRALWRGRGVPMATFKVISAVTWTASNAFNLSSQEWVCKQDSLCSIQLFTVLFWCTLKCTISVPVKLIEAECKRYLTHH